MRPSNTLYYLRCKQTGIDSTGKNGSNHFAKKMEMNIMDIELSLDVFSEWQVFSDRF